MEDREILEVIHGFVAEEHRLRGMYEQGELSGPDERSRLCEVEAGLDRMWDLLRRRRALRAAGLDPDGAELSPAGIDRYVT